MEERRLERLSRFVDGDLDPAEERELRSRLETDPVLAAELASLQTLRRSVADLAALDRPPADLDTLVEPLLRGRPERAPLRPWARWLAVAAVAIAGLTVIIRLNVGDRASGTAERVADRSFEAVVEPAEELAPAPMSTTTVPANEELADSADRLPPGPMPEVEIAQPTAPDVRGRLEEGSGRRKAAADIDAGGRVASQGELEDSTRREGRASAAVGDSAPPVALSKSGPPPASASPEERPENMGWREPANVGKGQLFVFAGNNTAWRSFETDAYCTPGRYSIRIRITDHEVAEVWPLGGAISEKTSQRLCAGQLVRGLAISGVEDGEYPAEVVVEARGGE